MPKTVEGCVHLIVRDGNVVHVVTHLTDLPQNGVVHLKGDKIYTFDEFKISHIHDHDELLASDELITIK